MAVILTRDTVLWLFDRRVFGGTCLCPRLFEGSGTTGNGFADSDMVISYWLAPSTL
jgi:hypothetical protein